MKFNKETLESGVPTVYDFLHCMFAIFNKNNYYFKKLNTFIRTLFLQPFNVPLRKCLLLHSK